MDPQRMKAILALLGVLWSVGLAAGGWLYGRGSAHAVMEGRVTVLEKRADELSVAREKQELVVQSLSVSLAEIRAELRGQYRLLDEIRGDLRSLGGLPASPPVGAR